MISQRGGKFSPRLYENATLRRPVGGARSTWRLEQQAAPQRPVGEQWAAPRRPVGSNRRCTCGRGIMEEAMTLGQAKQLDLYLIYITLYGHILSLHTVRAYGKPICSVQYPRRTRKLPCPLLDRPVGSKTHGYPPIWHSYAHDS